MRGIGSESRGGAGGRRGEARRGGEGDQGKGKGTRGTRTEVFGRAAKGLGERAEAHGLLAQAEVGDLDVPFLVEQQVLQLEVAVHNVALVQVPYTEPHTLNH